MKDETAVHDENGRFKKGNTASVGRSVVGKGDISGIDPDVDIRQLDTLLAELTTPQDVADVWDAVKKKAKKGDVKMATLFIERLGGKVKARVSNDVDMVERFFAMAERYRELKRDPKPLNIDTDKL